MSDLQICILALWALAFTFACFAAGKVLSIKRGN